MADTPAPDDTDGYTVGYKKPPVEHRFQKGQRSPNPGGRPRKLKGGPIDPVAILNTPIHVRDGERDIEIAGMEAMVRQVAKAAMGGTVTAIDEFLKACEDSGLLTRDPQHADGTVTVPVERAEEFNTYHSPNRTLPPDWRDWLNRDRSLDAELQPRRPRRRPRKANLNRSVREIVIEVALECHMVTEGGRRRRRTTIEIVLLALRNAAIKTNVRGWKLARKLIEKYGRRIDGKGGGLLIVPQTVPLDSWVEIYGQPMIDGRLPDYSAYKRLNASKKES